MIDGFNYSCTDCKHCKRGYSKLSGFAIKNDSRLPRVRTVRSKCLLNKPEFESWMETNKGKDPKDYTPVPDCFRPNEGLMYVMGTDKRCEEDLKYYQGLEEQENSDNT